MGLFYGEFGSFGWLGQGMVKGPKVGLETDSLSATENLTEKLSEFSSFVPQ